MCTSPPSMPHEKRRDNPYETDTSGAISNLRQVSGYWGVIPHHTDYKNKLPKSWLTSEEGKPVLSPWDLAWSDKQPRMLDTCPEEYRQEYDASSRKPRVKYFVDTGTEGMMPQRQEQSQLQGEQRSEAGTLMNELQQTISGAYMNNENATSQDRLVAHKLYGHRLPYTGHNSQSSGLNRPTAAGLHPVGGWSEIPDNELDIPLPVHPCHGGSAPLLSLQHDEPKYEANEMSPWQTKGSSQKRDRGGMPIWACLVDVQYRPKPWGNGERMPEDYYRARFRVAADGRLPSNVLSNSKTQL